MATRYFKDLSARIYWCPSLNVPVFTRECPGGSAIIIKATPPKDLRPALGLDYRLTREIILNYFGDVGSAERFLPSGKLVLLNKIPYPDAADEIIVDGQVVGHRFFDPGSLKWRFKPVYGGVAKIISEKIGNYAVANLPKLARTFVIHRGDLVEADLPSKGEYVAICTSNGLYQGVGEVIRGKRVRVLKAWRAVRYVEYARRSTWKDAVKANRDWIERREEAAASFLEEVYSKGGYGRKVFLSFSGGKDSLACYLITERALGEVPLLFNDTGIEAPHTVDYVRRFVEEKGLKLIVASGGRKFFKSLKVFGPPARDYRWCCKVVKLAPIMRAVRESFGTGITLSIVGQRKYESLKRAASPRVWVNPWMTDLISASPIQEWSSLEIWMYLTSMRARVNPLYFMGFDRIGCWLCPSCELAEFNLVSRLYPDLWREWEGYLKRWAESRGLPEDWVKYGLWRWRLIPGDQVRVVGEKRIKEVMGRDLRGVEVNVRIIYLPEKVRGVVSISGVSTAVIPTDLLHVVGEVRAEDENSMEVRTSKHEVRVTALSGGCSFEVKPPHGAEKVIKLLCEVLLRSVHCVGCGLCVATCKNDAIFLSEDGIRIQEEACTHCARCNEVCPLIKYSRFKLERSL